jgi:hypothetical protein
MSFQAKVLVPPSLGWIALARSRRVTTGSRRRLAGSAPATALKANQETDANGSTSGAKSRGPNAFAQQPRE